jgi:ADP-ribosylglycohydrolase
VFGAIVGDYLGALAERTGEVKVDFHLECPDRRFTDATVLTVATAEALMDGTDMGACYRGWINRFPAAGYGAGIRRWLAHPDEPPVGTAPELRASPAGWGSPAPPAIAARAADVAGATGDPGDGGALLVAAAVAIAREGQALQRTPGAIADGIRGLACSRWDHPLLDDDADLSARPRSGDSAPNAVLAVAALRDAENFEAALAQALRHRRGAERVVSITGGLAEAMFGGVPEALAADVWRVLPPAMQAVVLRFWQTP